MKLHNTVVKDIGPVLKPGTGQANRERIIKMVTDALWDLDGRGHIINETSKNRKSVEPIPERFSKYTGFQDWEKWKKKPRIDSRECELHTENVSTAADSSGISWPPSQVSCQKWKTKCQ